MSDFNSTYHYTSIPNSESYRAAFESFKLTNDENKNKIFQAVSELKVISENVLESHLKILLELDINEKNLQNKINEVIGLRSNLEWLFLELSEYLCKPINNISIKAMFDILFNEIVETIFIKIPIVDIDWRTLNTKRKREQIPTLEVSYNPYALLEHPIWTNGKGGVGENMFQFCYGLASDPNTGMIYVADYENSVILVYNKNGIFVTSFKNQGKLNGPRKLAVNGEFLYVIAGSGVLLKLGKHDGELIKENTLKHFIGGFDVHGEYIYGGDYYLAILYVLNSTYLHITKKLVLKPLTNKKDKLSNLRIQDLKSRREGVYILFKSIENILQLFSYQGERMKCFLPDISLNEIWFFNFDPTSNIIFTSSHSSIMRICTQDGKVLRTFERLSDSSAETIHCPKGVCITKDYRIIVANGTKEQCLQCF